MAMKTFSADKRGFTLLELMVVIIILGIMMGIAVPLLGNFARGKQLSIASEHISKILTMARSTAIARRRNVYVYFDTNTNEYWVTLYNAAPPALNNYTDAIGKIHHLPNSIEFDPSDPPPNSGGGNQPGWYVFSPTGQASNSQSPGTSRDFRLIDNSNNKYLVINVNNVTGRVKVKFQ